MATETLVKKPWEMTKAEREAEITQLKTENRAVLSTPLMSEGGVSPMQVGMMSKRQKERWQKDAMERMDIEARIKQLRASDEELATVEKARVDREREGRISQLNRQIADLKSIGIGKSGKMRPSYQRTLDIAEAELATLTGVSKPSPKPAKEPWEMTKGEYLAERHPINLRTAQSGVSAEGLKPSMATELAKGYDQSDLNHHWAVVNNALKAGKPVSPEVLKDYPDLVSKHPEAGEEPKDWRKRVVESAKQTWQIPRAEYLKLYAEHAKEAVKPQFLTEHIHGAGDTHKYMVSLALSEGKPVPAEVLKDYPELSVAKREGYLKEQALKEHQALIDEEIKKAGNREVGMKVAADRLEHRVDQRTGVVSPENIKEAKLIRVAATVKDVTPKGYGPSGEGKIVSPQIQKRGGETLDEAITREVGYQIDNDRVKLTEDKDGWKATVSGLTDEKPHVIRAYKKQQVLNEVWGYLNPSYVESKPEAPAKEEPKTEAGVKPLPQEGSIISRGNLVPIAYEINGKTYKASAVLAPTRGKLAELHNDIYFGQYKVGTGREITKAHIDKGIALAKAEAKPEPKVESKGGDWHDRFDFIQQHPAVIEAHRKVRQQQEKMARRNRWGEARRFEGRVAGNQLDELKRLRERADKAVEKAGKEYEAKVEAKPKPKPEPKPRKEIKALPPRPSGIQIKQSDRALAIDRSLLAKQVVTVDNPRWLKHPNRLDVRGIDTPGRGRIVKGVAYADRGKQRLSRRHHRGWKKVRFE